jgi:tetratricopeptide (TPR) repeat protein
MRRWLLILMLLPALLAPAADRADELTAAGVAEFTAAYQAWDGARFEAAAKLFSRATIQAPTSSICFYWEGTAQFHRMLYLQTLPPARANTLAANSAMESALAALNTAVKLDEHHAESHALLGTIYGMKIDGNVLRGLRFGPRVQKHQKQALEFGAENPRVRYLLGTGQFHLAKSTTSQREALSTLLAAEQLFVAEAKRPAKPMEPRWGHASCLTFIGRTYEMLGERTKAEGYFRQALTRQPTDHLAKAGLARVTEKK